jgi:hypothetical protein
MAEELQTVDHNFNDQSRVRQSLPGLAATDGVIVSQIRLSGAKATVEALRSGGTLQVGAIYAVPWTQGLASGTVFLRAVETGRFSQDVGVVSSFHSAATPAWSGRYDITAAAGLEMSSLEDHKGNRVEGTSQIGAFDWANTGITNCQVLDGASWTQLLATTVLYDRVNLRGSTTTLNTSAKTTGNVSELNLTDLGVTLTLSTPGAITRLTCGLLTTGSIVSGVWTDNTFDSGSGLNVSAPSAASCNFQRNVGRFSITIAVPAATGAITFSFNKGNGSFTRSSNTLSTTTVVSGNYWNGGNVNQTSTAFGGLNVQGWSLAGSITLGGTASGLTANLTACAHYGSAVTTVNAGSLIINTKTQVFGSITLQNASAHTIQGILRGSISAAATSTTQVSLADCVLGELASIAATGTGAGFITCVNSTISDSSALQTNTGFTGILSLTGTVVAATSVVLMSNARGLTATTSTIESSITVSGTGIGNLALTNSKLLQNGTITDTSSSPTDLNIISSLVHGSALSITGLTSGTFGRAIVNGDSQVNLTGTINASRNSVLSGSTLTISTSVSVAVNDNHVSAGGSLTVNNVTTTGVTVSGNHVSGVTPSGPSSLAVANLASASTVSINGNTATSGGAIGIANINGTTTQPVAVSGNVAAGGTITSTGYRKTAARPTDIEKNWVTAGASLVIGSATTGPLVARNTLSQSGTLTTTFDTTDCQHATTVNTTTTAVNAGKIKTVAAAFV